MTPKHSVRPTRRCLNDIGITPPPIDRRLDEIEQAPIAEAQALPELYEAGGVERIRSLKDRVWFKVKTSRWRGASTRLTNEDLDALRLPSADDYRWWLGAAGQRQDGSRSDFYAGLLAACTVATTPDKPHGVDSDFLLPGQWDVRRLRAELAYNERKVYEQVAVEAAARSLRSGRVVSAHFPNFSMGVLIRADEGQQFIAFIARGVYDPRQLAVMLDSFPGIDRNDWAAEPGGIANFQPRTGEVVWSALLEPSVADTYLELVPAADES